MDKPELAAPLTEEEEALLGAIPTHPVHEAVAVAINEGRTEDAERLLDSMALPSRNEIKILERRINTALRQPSRIRPPRRPPSRRSTRPRSRRPTSRVRARAPGREPDPDEPPPVNHAAAVDARLDVRERLVVALDELDADDPSSARFTLEGLLADLDAEMDGRL